MGYLDNINYIVHSFFSVPIDYDGFNWIKKNQNLAGVVGLEPTNGGIKTRCLTTWLHPKSNDNYIIIIL